MDIGVVLLLVTTLTTLPSPFLVDENVLSLVFVLDPELVPFVPTVANLVTISI